MSGDTFSQAASVRIIGVAGLYGIGLDGVPIVDTYSVIY
jgi:hypothetical protein